MKIISLEGPDFSGKSTLATSLVMKLRSKGMRVERMELPSRLITGIFTELLRNSKDKVDPRVFALVYAADHLHHYISIKDKNDVDFLILERSVLSYFIYEGLVLGVDMDWLKDLNKFNKLIPDMTAIVKVPVEELIKRKRLRVGLSDSFEKEEFIKKVANHYYNLPDWLKSELNVRYFEWEDLDKTTNQIIESL